MQAVIILLTLAAYAGAGYLWWRNRTPNFLIAIAAGQLGTLLAPLWQLLFRYNYNTSYPTLLSYLGQELPWPVFLGGWLAILPALVVFYLQRSRWWFAGYATGLLTFVLFVVYHLLLESAGVRLRVWSYDQGIVLPISVRFTLLSALMNGLVSLSTLSLLLLTRRYGLTSLLTIMLPAPLVLSLFVNGLLGAPLYTALFLRTLDMGSDWASMIGLLGTLGLLLWGAHVVASVIAGQQPTPRSA